MTISARKTALKGKLLHGYLKIAVSSGHSEEFESDPRQPVSTRRVPLASDAIHWHLKRISPFNHMAVMFCKSAVLASGNYQSIPYFEDYDLWVRNGSKEVSRCQFSRYARVCPYQKRHDRVVLPSRTFLFGHGSGKRFFKLF